MKSRFVAVFFPFLIMGGCASTGESPSATGTPAPLASKPASPAITSQTGTGNVAADLLNDPARRSVYFDYDSSLVKADYQTTLNEHAQYLAGPTGTSMVIQGNGDERGSREYNLALGQRRAEAVRQRLVISGARTNRIETVSFGEEKPRSVCHDESCWRENRRADLVYLNTPSSSRMK